jgi:tetratricopeptide (TPR) repeat protein
MDVKRRLRSIVLLLASLSGVVAGAEEPVPEAYSFSGAPLPRPEVPVEVRAETYERIAELEAQAAKTEEDFLALGYLYIEVGRFQGAIDAYGRGLAAYPDSFRLRRHRGHRYLNTRQLDAALADLERARVLLEAESDPAVPEYRLSGAAFGTYEHWIWYHLGLHRYLTGDPDGAAEAFRRCVGTATQDSFRVGATDWLWNSLQKAGRPEEAAAALAALPDELDVPDGYPYLQRIRVYRGELDPTALLDLDKPGSEWTGRDVTLGYGIAHWLRLQGEAAVAEQIHEHILASDAWNLWAYVATEREQAATP